MFGDSKCTLKKESQNAMVFHRLRTFKENVCNSHIQRQDVLCQDCTWNYFRDI